ncbi:hydrolase [Haliscomenobacter sp.]|uniref:hydrolase n=1 Tax=Haliscomenobacter sp. TaxID=2717303 RepID=UPI003BAA67A2
MTTQSEICCPKFEVTKWDNKTFKWDHKTFIKATVPTFLHIPLPGTIGRRMKKLGDLADKANANIPERSDALVLFHDPSAFQSEIFYSVSKDVEGAENTSLSGTFVAGVFDGPYGSEPQHIKTMEKRLAEEGKKAKDYYIHYAYCPQCAKKYGKNYMVLFAQV